MEDQFNDTQNSEEGAVDFGSPAAEAENRDPNTSAEGEAVEAPQEEEEKEMTLAEYKALQAQRNAPQYKTRNAGEGCDDAQWKKTYELKKKVEQQDDESEEESEEEEEQSRKINIDITFSDQPRRGGRGGRGRGGRGRGDFEGGRGGRGGRDRDFDGPRRGGRGGGFGQPRGRGGERGGGRKEAVPNTEDEREFPSLS